MSYNQHKLYEMIKKRWVIVNNVWMVGLPFSLILHHNMGIKCAEDPFNMGVFFTKGDSTVIMICIIKGFKSVFCKV